MAKLKLNGKPLDLNADSPLVAKVRKFLDDCGDEDLFTADYLCKKLEVSNNTLQRAIGTAIMGSPYLLRKGRVVYIGNPRLIESLRQGDA